MSNSIITVVFLCFCIGNAFSQSKQVLDTVNNMVYETIVKDNFIKLNRVTSQGELASCELEFQYSYRDFRAHKGATVMVAGSFSQMYTKGKNIGFLLKLVPNLSDVAKQTWTIVKPEYVNLYAGGKSIDKFKIEDFTCENGGKCIAYVDKTLELTLAASDPFPFDAQIKFSLNKGGIDNSFLMSSLLPVNESENVRTEFTVCMSDIVKKVANDITLKNK